MKNPKTPSQALRRIKEIKGRISTLTMRVRQSVCWEGEDNPTFEFKAVLEQRQELVAELVSLKTRLMRTNCSATLEFEGSTLTIQEAVFLMAEMKGELELYSSLRISEGVRKEHAGHDPNTGRMIFDDIKLHSAMREIERLEKVEKLEERISQLNDAVESANHRTDLVE